MDDNKQKTCNNCIYYRKDAGEFWLSSYGACFKWAACQEAIPKHVRIKTTVNKQDQCKYWE